MSGLRKCPSCGGLNIYGEPPEKGEIGYVICKDCGFCSAYDRWNIRADDTELEHLRELRKRVRKLENYDGWAFEKRGRGSVHRLWAEIIQALGECEKLGGKG